MLWAVENRRGLGAGEGGTTKVRRIVGISKPYFCSVQLILQTAVRDVTINSYIIKLITLYER